MIISPNSIGNQPADQSLKGLVGIYEAVFPNRIRGYYIEGSYADQTAISTSDIDLVIVFKHSFADDFEQAQAEQIAKYYDLAVSVELDIECLDEDGLLDGVHPSLKLNSFLLFGEPLGKQFPLISVEEWGRERMHAAYWLMNKVFSRPNVVIPPYDFPKPETEFYGYAERMVQLSDGRWANSTRDLVRVTGWMATALTAAVGEKIVARKKDCHILYRQVVNDEWAPLLESIYSKCRYEWGYLIPKELDQRRELQLICQQVLAFENHFLAIYQRFLITELENGDLLSKLHALEWQQVIPLIDRELLDLVEQLAQGDSNAVIRQQAREALAQIQANG